MERNKIKAVLNSIERSCNELELQGSQRKDIKILIPHIWRNLLAHHLEEFRITIPLDNNGNKVVTNLFNVPVSDSPHTSMIYVFNPFNIHISNKSLKTIDL